MCLLHGTIILDRQLREQSPPRVRKTHYRSLSLQFSFLLVDHVHFSQSLIDTTANNPVCVCSSSRKVTSIPRRNSTCTIVNCFNFGIRATLPLHHYYVRIRTLCNEQLNFERYSVVHYAFAKRSKFGDDRDRV